MCAPLDRGLFGFKPLVIVGVLALETVDFLFNEFHPPPRSVISLFADRLAFDFELDDAAIETVHHLGLGVDFHLDPGSRLVDQINGLVGKKTVGDVAMGEFSRRHNGGVGNLNPVVQFIALFEATEDGNSRFHRGLLDQNLLKPALERGVFFDVLAIFVKCRRADTVQFSPREGGFEHVACVHRAFGLAGTNHGVDLVNKHNRAAFVFGHITEHALEALFELTPIFRTGQQGGEIERQHALFLKPLGYGAVDNPLRKPFDNRRFTDTGFTDQHRVIFGASLQDLDRPTNFIIAPDYGVELALARALSQVDGVLAQGIALGISVVAIDIGAATNGIDRRLERFTAEPGIVGHSADFARALFGLIGDCQQEQFGGHKLVTALERLFFRQIQEIDGVPTNLKFGASARDLRQAVNGRRQQALQRGHPDAGPLQQRTPRPVALRGDGGEQMDGFEILVVSGQRQTLRICDGLLKLGRELIDAHEEAPRESDLASENDFPGNTREIGPFGAISRPSVPNERPLDHRQRGHRPIACRRAFVPSSRTVRAFSANP